MQLIFNKKCTFSTVCHWLDTHKHMCVRVRTHTHTHTHTHAYASTCACMGMCTDTDTHICICTHGHVHMCIYTYTQTHSTHATGHRNKCAVIHEMNCTFLIHILIYLLCIICMCVCVYMCVCMCLSNVFLLASHTTHFGLFLTFYYRLHVLVSTGPSSGHVSTLLCIIKIIVFYHFYYSSNKFFLKVC
jgi:hypothetical protein